MKSLRRRFLHLAVGAAALPAVSRVAWAQTYPTRPVRIIVSYPAGAAFTENSEIVVAEHGEWKRVYPLLPLSQLVALADEQLAAECRPRSPKEYRQSPCWPASSR